MFTLVHIYTATHVAKKQTPLLVIGSVIPDFVWVSRKFPYENLHNNIDDFYSWVKSDHEDMLDLALGMKLHSNAVGADKYSHFYSGGYAYVKGKLLLPDIIELIGSGDEKKIADLSHTFIEVSLDLHLYKDKPEILELYKKSLRKVDFDKISKIISKYAVVDRSLVLKDIKALFNLVKPENLVSEQIFASNVLPVLIDAGFHKKASEKRVLKILQSALAITKEDYKDLIDKTISMMQKDFSES